MRLKFKLIKYQNNERTLNFKSQGNEYNVKLITTTTNIHFDNPVLAPSRMENFNHLIKFDIAEHLQIELAGSILAFYCERHNELYLIKYYVHVECTTIHVSGELICF